MNVISRKAAKQSGLKRYFTGGACKMGHVCERQTSNGSCIACLSNYAQANRNTLRKNHLRWRQKNFATERVRIQQWAKNNSHKKNSKEARRRAALINRTPQWLAEEDKWIIEQAYALAALRTKMFGFAWHVDHIIPLQGKKVSGLHVPNNLQVIPGADNARKHCTYKVM